jgi:hypothetical protein
MSFKNKNCDKEEILIPQEHLFCSNFPVISISNSQYPLKCPKYMEEKLQVA